MDNQGNNRIAVYGSRRQEAYVTELSWLFSFLEQSGFRVFIHDRFAEYLEKTGVDMASAIPVEYIPAGVSLVLSIGGDGTFLRTARWVKDKEIPVLGINTGHLGYLSGCSLKGFNDIMDRICCGDIHVEKRMVLQVESPGLSEDKWPYALNEVGVLKDEAASMISVNTSLNGFFLADYRADGLIVATPTGSTAYNLSAGGPLVEPSVRCMILSPIAPHALTLRPLVVGDDSEITLSVGSRSGKFRLSLDDRWFILPATESIKIKKASFCVLSIRRKDTDFGDILREKLLWNASVQND